MRRMEQTHNFKSLWLSLVVTTALIAGHVSAQDEFCGMPDEVSNLLPGRTWLALPSARMGRELNASMGSAMCVT